MGCGASKSEANDSLGPLRLLPFSRRIEEFRQRRNGRTAINDATLYNKQLLDDEGEDGHTYPTDAPYSEIRKNVSSPPDGETSVGSRNGQSSTTGNDDRNKKGTADSDKNSKTTVVPAEEKTEGDVEKDNREGKDEEHHGEKEQDDGTGSGCGRDDEGEGDSLDGDSRQIGPGSPSFRDYFVSSATNEADIDSGDAGNGEVEVHQKTEEDEDHHVEKEQDDESSTGSNGDRDDGDNKDDKGEGGSLDGDGCQIGPESPSFKYYFVSSASNEADIHSGDASNGEERCGGVKAEDKPSLRKESNSSSDSGEGLAKKENRGKRFRNVLSKQGGVKNLLNVRSCYHPSTNTSPTSIHEKVEA